MDKKDSNLELYIIFAVLIIVVFFLGRESKFNPEEIEQTDTSAQQRIIDSLTKADQVHKDSVRLLNFKFDSVKTSRKFNHKKTNHEVIKIKNASIPVIDRWNDSVLSANGLK